MLITAPGEDWPLERHPTMLITAPGEDWPLERHPTMLITAPGKDRSALPQNKESFTRR